MGSYIKDSLLSNNVENFDYSAVDSLFLNSLPPEIKADSVKISDKKVDYEPELLDFSENELLSQNENPDRKLININTASISELTSVPGIGKITASRIIELRERRQGFKNLDELILVKGIGKSRLERFKKFFIIE